MKAKDKTKYLQIHCQCHSVKSSLPFHIYIIHSKGVDTVSYILAKHLSIIVHTYWNSHCQQARPVLWRRCLLYPLVWFCFCGCTTELFCDIDDKESFDPNCDNVVNDSIDPDGLRQSCNDTSVRCDLIFSGRWRTNPSGCSSSNWYFVFIADVATRTHAPNDEISIVNPMSAWIGSVKSKNSKNPIEAVPTRSNVCDFSTSYSLALLCAGGRCRSRLLFLGGVGKVKIEFSTFPLLFFLGVLPS